MSVYLTEFELRENFGYQAPHKQSLKDKCGQIVRCDQRRFKDFLVSFLPVLTWLPNYSIRKHLFGDIVAGLTIAIIRIPQGLAYGLLAGAQPINGIYTGFFSPLIYAFLGTSPHVSVGTFAVLSLMLGTAMDKFLGANPYIPSLGNTTTQPTPTTIVYASSTYSKMPEVDNIDENPEFQMYKLSIVVSITMLVGIIQIMMGIFNLGFVAIFLSDSLVSGFTTGAAVYVFTSQLKHFFGIKFLRQSPPFSLMKTYYQLFAHLGETNWAAVVVSVLTIVPLYSVKLINIKYKKQLRNMPIPMELIIVITFTAVSAALDLRGVFDVETVKEIRKGRVVFRNLGFGTKGIFNASCMACKVFVNIKELFALGVAQISCSFFQGHACAGALARSSVKESSGAKTQLSDVISCLVILLVLLFVGPLFKTLPLACLASIIMVNIRTLFLQVLRLPDLWKLCKYDFSVWIITFVATILIGVDIGLMIGVVALLATVVLRKYSTAVNFLGKLGQTPIYRDQNRFEQAKEVAGVKIIRFDQSPFFGNKESLETIGTMIGSLKKKCDAVEERLKIQIPFSEPEGSQPVLADPLNDTDTDEASSSLLTSTQLLKQNRDTSSKSDCVIVDYKHKNIKYKTTSSRDQGRATSPCHDIAEASDSFNTVIFDCSTWTFIDTMGMDTVKQVCSDMRKMNLRVFLAGMQPVVFNKLSEVDLFTEDCEAVPYPSVDIAVQAAQATPM